MSKGWQPTVPFPIQSNATTTGPELVTLITNSSGLRSRTFAVVLTDNGCTVQFFRESSAEPGTLSCDEYVLESVRWRGPEKHHRKYSYPEAVPPGRQTRIIDGVEFHSLQELSDAEVNVLRVLLRQAGIADR